MPVRALVVPALARTPSTRCLPRRPVFGPPSTLPLVPRRAAPGLRALAAGPGAISGVVGSLASGAVQLLGEFAKVYGLLVVAVFLLQRKLIFMPPVVVVDPRREAGGAEVILRDKGKDSPDRFAAIFFHPKTDDAPVLVYFHGNADQLGWGAAYFGSRFAEVGLGLYGIEYPGYGLAKPGQPTEASMNAAAEAMLEHLVKDIGVPNSRIVLFGQSIGCSIAVEMARRGWGASLVLLSPFTRMRDMAASAYPFLAPALRLCPFLVRDPMDNLAKARKLRLPTLVLHGTEDEVVPFWMGEKLAKAIPGARFVGVRYMGHNDTLDRPEVLKTTADFARQHARAMPDALPE